MNQNDDDAQDAPQLVPLDVAVSSTDDRKPERHSGSKMPALHPDSHIASHDVALKDAKQAVMTANNSSNNNTNDQNQFQEKTVASSFKTDDGKTIAESKSNDKEKYHSSKRESAKNTPKKELMLSAPPIHDDGDLPLRSSSSMPGAIAVAGYNRNYSSSSIVYGDDPTESTSAPSSFAEESSATTNAGNDLAISIASSSQPLLPPSSSSDHVVEAEVVNDDLIRNEITQQVRHELMQEVVHACAVIELDNDDVMAGQISSLSASKHNMSILSQQKAMLWKQRAAVFVCLAAAIIVAVVLGVVLSKNRNNNTSSPISNSSAKGSESLAPSSAPTAAPARCSFCYDGVESVLTDLTLASVARTKQSCADLSTISTALSPNDTACVTSQADAWLYCGCPLLPPRPVNPNCTACYNQKATGNSTLCPKYDTYVAIVGSVGTCRQLTNAIVFKNNCTCF